jgi:endonuclease/exonuclease/phosphatase (EEP) superfamily protein YafD
MRLLLSLFLLAPLGVPALILLANLARSGHRWPDILVQFTAPALVGTVLLAIGYLVIRRHLHMIAAALVGLGLLAVVWPQWAPEGERPSPGAPVIRVYSANVWIRNPDVAAIRRSIEAADADIVMLIELGPEARDHMDDLLEGYPYRTETRSSGERLERAVIAARFPISEFGRRADGLHAIMATGETPLGPMTFIVTHLTRPWPFEYQYGQISQVESLTERVAPLDGPVLIAGDFNSVTAGRIGRMIRTDMDLVAAPGWPGTWPSQAPSPLGMTIDQVYVTRDLAVRSRRLGEPNGSDHRPVITEIGLAPSGQAEIF